MESIAPNCVFRREPRVRAHTCNVDGPHNEIFIDARAGPSRVVEHRYACLTSRIHMHVMRYGKVLNLGSSCAR